MENSQRKPSVTVTHFEAFSPLDNRRAEQIGKVFGIAQFELGGFYCQQLGRLGDLAARHAGGDYSRLRISESMDGNLLKLVSVDSTPFGEIWVDPTTRPLTVRTRIGVGENIGEISAVFPGKT
jgi:hypothetical protein